MSSTSTPARPATIARESAGPRLIALGAALLLTAGCGGALSSSSGSPGELAIDAGSQAIRTGDQLRLSANNSGSGEPAAVRWRVVASNNAAALGSGTVSADGVYTPPSTLSRDAVTVTLEATPLSGAATGAVTGASAVRTTLTITPGFVQPLQPENATIAPGAAIEVRAQIAEVGSGHVTWRLAAPNPAEAAQLGSLGVQHCERAWQKFTTCTVTYTAPSAASATPGNLVWLTASTQPSEALAPVITRARLMLSTDGLTSNPSVHQAEQSGPIALGGSGGNDNDFDTYQGAGGTRYVADCCGGTLGALVQSASGNASGNASGSASGNATGATYILSNNHVLAESDQGHPGDTIEQPGLIDDGCLPLSRPGAEVQPVGTLRYAVPLKAGSTNVDAALASVNPGMVKSSGAILELGDPKTADLARGTLPSAPPTAGAGEALDAARLDGLSVAKSGRTTGLTCSTVDAVDLTVQVDYYKDCAETEPYLSKTFTGQIGVGGDAFADAGDSGALVVDAANARAVGLLYATGTAGESAAGSVSAGFGGMSLVNPIGDILSELSSATGSPLTLRGTSAPHPVACLDYDASTRAARAALSTLAPGERARLDAAMDAAESLRSSNARVLAVAEGTSGDAPGEGAILIYTDNTQPRVAVPATIKGVRTVVVSADLATIARGPSAWPAADLGRGIDLSPQALATARAAVERLAPRLLRQTAIFGVGAAQSVDAPGEPALLLLLDKDAPLMETEEVLRGLASPAAEDSTGQIDAETTGLPAVIDGLRVRYVAMHRFRVTESKYVTRGTPSSCAPRGLDPRSVSRRVSEAEDISLPWNRR